MAGERHAWIDWVKAISIVEVVWIHSMSRGLNAQPTLDVGVITLRATEAAVPAFFFVSGFLNYSGTGLSVRTVGGRIWQLLPAYVLSSAVMVAWQGQRVTPLTFGKMLIGGWAIGIYYFVPMLAVAVASGWLLSRLRGISLWAFVLLTLCSGALALHGYDLVAMATPHYRSAPFWWQFRSPARWLGYFVAGWVLARYWPNLRSGIPQQTGALAVVLMLIGLLIVTQLWQQRTLVYCSRYCFILGIGLLFYRSENPRPVRLVSESTYAVYLYHFPVVVMFQNWLHLNLLAFAGAAILTITAASILHLALGRRARLIIG